MKNEWNQHLYQNKYDEINSNNDDVDVNYMNMDDVDSNVWHWYEKFNALWIIATYVYQTSSQSQSQIFTGNFVTQSDEQTKG